MELSPSHVEGLHLAGDSARLPNEYFSSLIECIFHNLLQLSDQIDIADKIRHDSCDLAAAKQAYAAIFTLLLEAAKRDFDSAALSSFLEENKLDSSRRSIIIKQFEKYKIEIQANLSSIGHTLPHIVDADWRLDYRIKNDVMEKINEPSYLIVLKTEKPGQKDTENVQFSCNTEQLQDLVSKLKDAVKCLEKISQG